MPYKSAKQRAYMHIHLPKIAARWDREYGGKVQGDKMPNRKAMFKDALNRAKAQQTNMGQHVGRNPTPGTPRKVGSMSGTTPPILNRREIAPGEPDPNTGETPSNPPIIRDPRNHYQKDRITVGERRLGKLSDKNKANDKKGLKPLLRMYMRASQGKGFGGKVFGQRAGTSLADFFKVTRPYTKGTGYGKMLSNLTSQAGPGVIPGVKPEPRPYPGKPRPKPKYIPRDNNTHYVR